MSERLRGFLQEQRVPLSITALALFLAVAIGLVPVMNADDNTAAVERPDDNAEIMALEQRLVALEEAAADNSETVSPAIRAELDLMAKGLLNQTSRVSALKKQVASLSSLLARLDRIDLEAINLSKAVGRLHQRVRSIEPEDSSAAEELSGLRKHVAAMQTQVEELRTSMASMMEKRDASVAAGSGEKGALTAIETKLDQILQSVAK